jgi:uncharacterized protein (DUF736 family)
MLLLDIEIRPAHKTTDREPDYRVFADKGERQDECGAGWHRRGTRGRDFVSLSIDDPTWPGALNFLLLLDSDGQNAVLVWTRVKRKPSTALTKTEDD